MGIGEVAGVSAGLSFSQDTYRGFGVGTFAGIGIGKGIGENGQIGINAQVSSDPIWGNNYSIGVGAGIGKTGDNGLRIGGNIGLSTNFQSVTASGGVSVAYHKPGHENRGGFDTNLVGGSISTSKSGTMGSVSVGGATINNDKIGNVSTSSFGFTLPLPLIHIGYRYQRYWIDEMAHVNTFGSLYNPTSAVTGGFDYNAFDSYSLLDPEAGIVDNPDPNKVLGGSFLSFDNYTVLAQGVSGYMRPYAYKDLIFRQSIKLGDAYEVKQYNYPQGYNDVPLEFRFIGDFSNRHIYSGGTMATGGSSPLNPSFSGTSTTGENGLDGIYNGHLSGSRHIEWYTNNQILNTDESKDPQGDGFIDCTATGFVRSSNGSLGKQIGGYKITNETGVTYHFALPAYVFEEYSYSENIDQSEGLKFNELSKPEPYAYTWYLTAVTGPDFVDRGPSGVPDGILNEYDWGYWVAFEYGKWTDKYTWRNPSEGMTVDIDNQFQNFSEGRKEIYYLDIIKTKTHTALFFKDIRHDAKSALYFLRDRTGSTINAGVVVNEGNEFKIVEGTKTGGFLPTTATCNCELNYYEMNINSLPMLMGYDRGSLEYTAIPTSTMKLQSIYLIENQLLNDIPLSKSFGDEYELTKSFPWNVVSDGMPSESQNCDFSPYTYDNHLYENVLDINDLEQINQSNNYQLKKSSLRIIELNTGYSLSPETSNSFDNNILRQSTVPQGEDSYPKFGKLTLNSVAFLGKGGADIVPPIKFSYDLSDPVTGIGTLSKVSGALYGLSSVNSGLQTGDIIQFIKDDTQYWALVLLVNGSVHGLKMLGKGLPSNGTISFAQTKNPPYNKDAYDMWGLYKSDYVKSESENISRLVTELSAKNLDVWSLRKITSPTGADILINYEPDRYENAIQYKGNLVIQSLENDSSPDVVKITFYSQQDLTKLNIQEGESIRVIGSLRYNGYHVSPHNACLSDGDRVGNLYMWKLIDQSSIVEEVDNNFLKVRSHELYSQLNYIHEAPLYIDCDSYSVTGQATNAIYEFAYPGVFIGGNVLFNKPLYMYGGGTRVTEITLRNVNSESTTSYVYSDGTTSYEPFNIDNSTLHTFNFERRFNNEAQKKGIKAYKNLLYQNFSRLLAISRELPAPGIVYKSVKVREKHNGMELPTEIEYEFQTFDEGDIGLDLGNITETSGNSLDGITFDNVKTREVQISDFSARLGQLKRVIVYHGQNKISEKINNYLFDDAVGSTIAAKKDDYKNQIANRYNSQGVIQETTIDARFAKSATGQFDLLGTLSRKHYYPVVLTEQKAINYKTGVTTSIRNLGYDFYSGQVTKTEITDGYGHTYRTELTSAYKKYGAMGLAANGGRNMLTQEASSYTYKINPADGNRITGLAAAMVQTWSDQVSVLSEGTQAGIWRKHASYSFIGDNTEVLDEDGLYPLNNTLPEFSRWTTTGPSPAGWQKNDSITLYDRYSHALEASDINSSYAATKMSSDQNYIFSSAVNSRYNQFAYSGAEDNAIYGIYGGDVQRMNGAEDTVSHTGSKSLKLTINGQRAFLYTVAMESDKPYRASVWVNASGGRIYYKVGSAAPVPSEPPSGLRQAGGWYLLTLDIPSSSVSATLDVWCGTQSGTCHFDDFRIHPAGAVMTSYVYNKWGELTHILDHNNIFTQYEYDGMGRLYKTYRETFKNEIVNTSVVNYHYSGK